MSYGYILHLGAIVVLPDDKFDNFEFDLNGFLIGFDRFSGNQTLQFRYYDGKAFYDGKTQNILKPGFYLPSDYEIYINDYIRGVRAFPELVGQMTIEDLLNEYPVHAGTIVKIEKPVFNDHTGYRRQETILFEVHPNINVAFLSDSPYPEEYSSEMVFAQYYYHVFPEDQYPEIITYFNRDYTIKYPELNEDSIYGKRENPSIINHIDYNNLNNPTQQGIYKFFNKNFIELHGSWSLDNNNYDLIHCHSITYRIAYIIEIITSKILPNFFPELNQSTLISTLDYGNQWNWNGQEYDQNNILLYRIAHALFEQWGFYSNISNYGNYIPIFKTNDPDIEERSRYLENIKQFYRIWKYNSKDIKSEENIYIQSSLFFKVSTIGSLALLPAKFRIEILRTILRLKWYELKENIEELQSFYKPNHNNIQFRTIRTIYKNEQAIEKLLRSFTPSDSNELLDFLNSELTSSEKTKFFQVLYNKLKDDQGFFGSQMTNKGNVMTHLMYLWMVSNYNPFFVNLFADTTLQETIDLNNNLTETRTPVVLNYKSMSIGFLKFNNINFHFENGQIRPIETVETVSYKLQPTGEGPWEQVPILNKSEYKLNLLSIFQPISLTDFDQNSHAVKVQMINLGVFGYEEHNKTALLPAFFLKYMDDYEDVESYWNQVSLTVDIVLTFVGFYGLTYLRHLRHVGKLGKLLRAHKIGPAALDAINMVEVIATLKIGANVIEITASTAHLILRFTTDNCSDFQNDMVSWINVQANNQSSSNNIQLNDLEDSPIPPNQLMTYELCRELDKILSIIALSAAFADISLGIALNNRIKYIKDNNLIPQELITISSPTYNPDIAAISAELGMIDDIFANLFTNFENLFSNVNNVAKRNELLGILNAPPFNNTKRIAFVEDITPIIQKYSGKPNELLDVLAKNNFKIVENWKLLEGYASLSKYRRMQKVLESSLHTDRLIVAAPYQEVLTRLSKYPEAKQINFIDEMGGMNANQWEIFNNNPNLVDGWFKYHIPMNTRSELKALKGVAGNDYAKVIKWCQRYGDISDEAFRNLKAKAAKVTLNQKFEYLLDFPDATHDIIYFNKRRAEMLPPGFEDVDKQRFYGTQEVDSFIELELLSGGKARPSLANEAGDIIMEGGSLHGLSLDPMGLSHKSIIGWSNKFNKEFKKFKENAIDGHFEKIFAPTNGRPALDKVVIDYKYMDDISQAIGQSPNYLKNQVDLYIETKFQQFNNSTYLIKLNY